MQISYIRAPPLPRNCQKHLVMSETIQRGRSFRHPKLTKKHHSKVTWQKSAIWPLPCYKDSHWPRLKCRRWRGFFVCSLKCWKSNFFWEHGALTCTSSFIWLWSSNKGDSIWYTVGRHNPSSWFEFELTGEHPLAKTRSSNKTISTTGIGKQKNIKHHPQYPLPPGPPLHFLDVFSIFPPPMDHQRPFPHRQKFRQSYIKSQVGKGSWCTTSIGPRFFFLKKWHLIETTHLHSTMRSVTVFLGV